MATSPTENSLKALRREGWTVGILEKWNGHTKRREDLWGFADLIAMREGDPPLLIQTTSYPNVSARLRKMADIEEAHLALRAGFNISVHGWRKPKHRWECRIVALTQDTLASWRSKPSDPSSDIRASPPTTGSSSSTSRTRSTRKRGNATPPPNSSPDAPA